MACPVKKKVGGRHSRLSKSRCKATCVFVRNSGNLEEQQERDKDREVNQDQIKEDRATESMRALVGTPGLFRNIYNHDLPSLIFLYI